MSGLFNEASLVLVPSGYKSGKVYSEVPTDGDGDLTFTRASSATRVNSDGEIEVVGSGVPRLDYSQGSCPALLLEPQRTNSFAFSENITNFSTLGRLNCGYTLGSSFGSFTTSCLITSTGFTASNINAVLGFNSVNTQNNYLTIRFQKKSGWYLNVISGNGCAAGDLRINLASGGGYISSSGTMLTDYKIVEFSDYFQIGFKTTQIATTSAGLVNLRLYDNASFANYNDAGGTTFNISGIQWENQQTYGTSYIPTSGATVTRLADVCSKTGISSLIGQTEGTLFAEVEILNNAVGWILDASDGTTTNRTLFFKLTNNQIRFLRISTTQSSSTAVDSSILSLGVHKIALAYQSGNTAFFIDGVQISTTNTATFTNGTLNKISLGTAGDGSGNQLGDRISQAIIFPTRLSNTQLAELTTL